MDLVVKLALGKTVTEKDIEEELFYICDNVHSSCDSGCPVYELNGHEAPSTQDFDVNRGCDCFKSGKNMLKFIREKGNK